MRTPKSTSNAHLTYYLKAERNTGISQIVKPLIALLQFEKTTVTKGSLLCATCMVLLFSSCQKGSLTEDTIVNSTSSSAASATANSTAGFLDGGKDNTINYGAFISPPGAWGGVPYQLSVAGKLGVSCLRAVTPVPDYDKPNALLGLGYDVLLNFDSNIDAYGDNSSFNESLEQYAADLTNALLLCIAKPVVAVIENEESNPYFYAGSAADYIRQLKVAISVMHANGIKITNGGITNTGLNYLVYRDFQRQGKSDSAEQFRRLTNVQPNNYSTQYRGAFVDSLLDAYKVLDLDYVNFHWKATSPDTESLREVINYQKKRSNKPIINNELGQYDKDPNTLLAHVQLCTDMGMPYIIWYSPDQNLGRKAMPLQYSDASLTPTGMAYQAYLAQ